MPLFLPVWPHMYLVVNFGLQLSNLQVLMFWDLVFKLYIIIYIYALKFALDPSYGLVLNLVGAVYNINWG